MINLEQMALILKALPDPAFILSRSGKYLALFGGRDARYYHDGSGLVGCYIADLIKPDKARWFLDQIALALDSRQLLIAEYELSNRDVKDLPDDGPQQPIWFEGRVQALDFQVSGEDVVLWVASNISARHELELQLKALSDTDQLTGLFNRRKLEYELASHYELSARYAVLNSILMFDLDNLKIINDNLGHQVGDELIQVVAAVCRSELRQNDIACRFGGDEFVIVLPNTGPEQALQFACRLHQLLQTALSRFVAAGSVASVSIGVASMVPEDGSFSGTLQRADRALYQAKKLGKNQVIEALTGG